MHAFAQRLFLMFGLRRRMAAKRTPATLQVDRTLRLVTPSYFELFRGPQRPCKCRIGVEVRDGGFKYIRPIANEPRTA